MTQSFESHTITNAFQTQAATFCVIVSGVLASLAVSGIVTLLVSCLMIVLTVVSVIVSIAVPVCGFVVGKIARKNDELLCIDMLPDGG